MATRVAIISIAVENPDSVRDLNRILHENGEYIIGRMGIPYPKRGVSLISVVMDAPADAIPGGASPVGELPQAKGEDIQPARHDLLPPGE